MPKTDEKEKTREDRERSLLEYEILENTQAKLVEWAKGRFWWIIVLGGIALGTSGYGLIQSMLSTANKATILAELKAQLASDATDKAKAQLSEVNTALADVKRQTEKAADLALQVRHDFDKLTNANVEARLLIQQVQELAHTVRSNLVELAARQTNLTTTQAKFGDEVKLSTESFRIRFLEFEQRQSNLFAAQSKLEGQIQGMQVDFTSVRQVADPTDASLKALLQKLQDPNLSLSEKTALAAALGQRGTEARSALATLKQEWERVVKEEYSTERGQLSRALASAIARIQGQDSLGYFTDAMRDATAPFQRRYTAGTALKEIPGQWSKKDIDFLTVLFGQTQGFSREHILECFYFSNSTFLDSSAKEAALELVIAGINDKEEVVVQNAAYAIKYTFSDAVKALDSLRKAAERCKDPNVTEALRDAIKAIESPKPNE